MILQGFLFKLSFTATTNWIRPREQLSKTKQPVGLIILILLLCFTAFNIITNIFVVVRWYVLLLCSNVLEYHKNGSLEEFLKTAMPAVITDNTHQFTSSISSFKQQLAYEVSWYRRYVSWIILCFCGKNCCFDTADSMLFLQLPPIWWS